MSFRFPLRVSAVLALALLAMSGCGTVQVSPQQPGERAVRHEQHPAIAEAATLAEQDATLTGSARSANAQAIQRLLTGLDDAALQREADALPAEHALYPFVGQELIARRLPLPKPFARGNWQFDAGNRPAADRDGYRPPMKLGVLLPMTGSLAAAAAPVRDGFLAGYYGELRRRPDITFYDTAAGASAAYDRAVADGNDFVVGPLGREEVTALFGRSDLSVPVLALNRGSNLPPRGSASFSLSPEDEGVAAANYLLARGARRVLLIGGADDTQRRALLAFREHLLQRGGTVTDTLSEGVADFTAAAQREGGVDGIFLALRGSAARTVMPKLAEAGLAGKPRVATSALASGTGKATDDAALDGIVFPAEAWEVHGAPGLPSHASVAGVLPNARGPAARLFAFGYDAWRITAFLEKLALATDADLPGATGDLSLDGFGNIVRRPAWSTFSGGTVIPLPDAR